jgi:uncharacterized protein with LGFP repeats
MSKLTVNESIGDFNIVKIFGFEEIDANLGSTKQLKLGKVPVGGAVEVASVFARIPLASTADDYTIDVGATPADPDELIDASALTAGAQVSYYNTGDAYDAGTATATTGLTQPVLAGNANEQTILVEFNGTGDLTAGEIVVALRVSNPGRFKN